MMESYQVSLLQQSISLAIRAEILTQKVVFEALKPQTIPKSKSQQQLKRDFSSNSSSQPKKQKQINEPQKLVANLSQEIQRLCVDGKMIYKTRNSKDSKKGIQSSKKVKVIYQQFESNLVDSQSQNLGISPQNFMQIIEEKIKKIILSHQLKKLKAEQLDEKKLNVLGAKIQSFINYNLQINFDSKLIINSEKVVQLMGREIKYFQSELMKYNSIKFKFNENQTHRNYQELLNLRELLKTVKFGITCLKSENNLYCLSFVHYCTPQEPIFKNSKFKQLLQLERRQSLSVPSRLGSSSRSSRRFINMGDIFNQQIPEEPLPQEEFSQAEVQLQEVTFDQVNKKELFGFENSGRENQIAQSNEFNFELNEEEKVEEHKFNNLIGQALNRDISITESSESLISSPALDSALRKQEIQISIAQVDLFEQQPQQQEFFGPNSCKIETSQSLVQNIIKRNSLGEFNMSSRLQINQSSQDSFSGSSEIKSSKRHSSYIQSIPKLNLTITKKTNEINYFKEMNKKSQSFVVPSRRIIPMKHQPEFEQMIDEHNEVRDVLKNQITDMKDRLQANKLFMNMVIHDLRSPSENIQHGLAQAKELIEKKVSQIMQKTQEMIQNKILGKQQELEGTINSAQVSFNLNKSIRRNMFNAASSNQQSEHNSILQGNKLSQIHLNSDSNQQSNKQSKHSKYLNQSQQEYRPSSSINNPQISFNEEEIQNSIFTIQEVSKGEINLSSKQFDGGQAQMNFGQEEEKVDLKKYSKKKSRSSDDNLVKKLNEVSPLLNKNLSKIQGQQKMNAWQVPPLIEYIPLINNIGPLSVLKSPSQQYGESSSILSSQRLIEDLSQFDFDSEEMNEDYQANLPKHTDCNDNVGVMRSSPKSQIQFIEKVQYVDRKPFLGVDRKVQTDPCQVFQDIQDKNTIPNQDIQNYKLILQILKIPQGQGLSQRSITLLNQVGQCVSSSILPDSQIIPESIAAQRKNSPQQNDSSFQKSFKNSQKQVNQELKKSWSQQDISYKFVNQIVKRREQSGVVDGVSNQNNSNSLSRLKRPSSHLRSDIRSQIVGLNKIKFVRNSKSEIQDKESQQTPGNNCCSRCINIAHFFLSMFEEFTEANQKMDLYVQQSIASAFTLTNLINDLLDLAKMETATFNLAIEQFNMFEVIAEAYQIMLFQAELKGVKLIVEFNQNQPFIFRKVFGDKRRFLQILLNFVSNSLKFTNTGGFVRIQLAVVQEQIKKCTLEDAEPLQTQNDLFTSSYEQNKFIKLKIVIEDSGVGIKKENLHKIFQDYSRLDEHQKMNDKGTGLGMSICKRIVDQMGGKCTIDSEVGVGSQVTILLQMKVVDKIIVLNELCKIDIQDVLKNAEAYKYSPDFSLKFEKESSVFPNDLSLYMPEIQSEMIKNELIIEPKVIQFAFNPLGINQSRNKNQKIIEKLKLQLCNYSELQKLQINQSVISSFSDNVISGNQPVRNNSKQEKSNPNHQMDNSMIIDKVFNLQKQQQQENSILIENSVEYLIQIIEDEFELEEEKVSNMCDFSPNFKQQNARNVKQFQQISDQRSKLNMFNHSSNYSQQKLSKRVGSYEIPKQISLNSQSEINTDQSIIPPYQSAFNSSAGLVSQSSNTTNKVSIQKLIYSVQQYKEKKLRLLVANDDAFQLLIVTNSLEKIEVIEHIDQANNGQEALDLVKQNEKDPKEKYYDLIFLDLHMPILNGYEACSQIVKFYENQRSENILKELNVQEEEEPQEFDVSQYQKLMWMNDLQMIYRHYLQRLDHSNQNQSNIREANYEIIEAQKILRIFKLLYRKVKYRALSQNKQPAILAYSSLVTDEIIKQTKEAGFLDCLSSPLTVLMAKQVISQHLDTFVEKYLDNKFVQAFHQMSRFSQFLVDYQNIESLQSNHIPSQMSLPQVRSSGGSSPKSHDNILKPFPENLEHSVDSENEIIYEENSENEMSSRQQNLNPDNSISQDSENSQIIFQNVSHQEKSIKNKLSYKDDIILANSLGQEAFLMEEQMLGEDENDLSPIAAITQKKSAISFHWLKD